MSSDNKPKHMYEKEDWDKVSIIHFLHRKITGIPLHNSLLVFYLGLFLVVLILSFFIRK